MIRYRVLDLPARGVGAFTPLPAWNPVASSYGLVHIDGSPGTDPTPSPRPSAVPSATTRPRTSRDSAQDSAVAPDVIFPAVYIPRARNMGPAADLGLGMATRRLNPLPVRARDPGRFPVPVMIQFPAGTRSQLPWPRAFQRWPIRGQKAASGAS